MVRRSVGVSMGAAQQLTVDERIGKEEEEERVVGKLLL